MRVLRGHRNDRIAAAVTLYERERITLGDAFATRRRRSLDDAVYEPERAERAGELDFNDETSDERNSL